jgi:hypothetical protein
MEKEKKTGGLTAESRRRGLETQKRLRQERRTAAADQGELGRTERKVRKSLRLERRKVVLKGWSSIDMRSTAAQQAISWRDELITALGGDDAITPQRRALVDSAARTQLFLGHIDAFLVQQPSIINQRKKCVFPLVKERQVLADSLARLLAQIGLERIPKPVGTLQDYIEKYSEGETHEKSDDDPPADDGSSAAREDVSKTPTD